MKIPEKKKKKKETNTNYKSLGSVRKILAVKEFKNETKAPGQNCEINFTMQTLGLGIKVHCLIE